MVLLTVYYRYGEYLMYLFAKLLDRVQDVLLSATLFQTP